MKIGDIVNCTVDKVFPTYLIVKAPEDYEGLVHIASISDYYVSNLNSLFQIDQKYEFEVIDLDEGKKWLKLSWKSIVPRFQKNPFEYELSPTKNGFKNLKENTIEGEEND